ncbi:AGE family epimerase/isomerase [Aestuariispira insulae]|uniref:Mannose-6-phosphate isomerase n=1 Tax=Aestuariispira insulae TaxID=1461337 RepID=A0A3D9HGE8_9PROT|nr:AGE family epimerase/isomerase [Aestuariispira insulae]RED48557.1 mannose-6-phosphate isomerase [Aestuariispira insulae]
MQTASDHLRAHFHAFEEYIREGMLPLWRGYGWRDGIGCHERLDSDSLAPVQDFHRLMNLSRQLFVFSCAFKMWRNPVDAHHAKCLYETLTSKFWDETHGGWFFSIHADGSPKDRRKDLYGHAFLLFGLAHFNRVFEVEEAIELARKTDDLLQEKLKLDSGWFAFEASEDWQIQDRALRQNPHMHLLEAYLALEASDHDPRWRLRILTMAQLTVSQLMDAQTGLIREYFDENGAPCPERGDLVEPGHQFEWSWLIGEIARLAGPSGGLEEKRQAVFEWTERTGMDPQTGGIYNQLNITGAVQDKAMRLWPVTEYLKAVSTLPSLAPVQRQERLADGLAFLMDHYLQHDGRWHEHLAQDLTVTSDFIPASSMYHLMMAYLVLREAQSKA